MNESFVTVVGCTHTGICLVNRIRKFTCKINFAIVDFYTQHLIRD